MGAWGVNSDENDSASDAIDGIKNGCGLYADADEMSPLEGQALADAQDAALLTRDVPWKAEGLVGSVMALLREGFRVPSDMIDRAKEELSDEDVTVVNIQRAN